MNPHDELGKKFAPEQDEQPEGGAPRKADELALPRKPLAQADASNPGGEEPMVRPMYGDLAAQRITQSQSEPVFLEKRAYGAPAPEIAPAPKMNEPKEGARDPLENATHEKNTELLAEELKKKTARSLERADEIKANLTPDVPKVNLSEELHGDKPLKTLRTFQGDAAEAMKRQNASAITVQVAETERKREVKEKKREEKIAIPEAKPLPEPEPRKEEPGSKPAAYGIKAMTLFLSVLLILVGLSIVYIFNYFSKDRRPAPTAYTTLLPYDSDREVNVTGNGRESIVGAFALLRDEAPGPQGSVTHLQIRESGAAGEKEVASDRFLALMGAKAPQSLMRAFEPKMMAGLYATSKNEPFIILRISSFDNAYSGMLEWEWTLTNDIGVLFSGLRFKERREMRTVPAAAGTSTAPVPTYGSDSPGLETAFEDLLVQNIDTRIARNENGEVALLYSFVDRQTLVITTNEAAFRGIVEKLRASKLIR